MTRITVVPATQPRAPDVEAALCGGGDGRSCQCQWWTLRARDFTRTTRDQREALLREEMAGPVAPGLVVRVDGAAAGWVRVGSRPDQPRLARTRLLAAHSREPWDDPAVWAITCFSVRREFRGLGLMGTLTEAAAGFAATHGARLVEAYPVDTYGRQVRSNDLFHGSLDVFLRAGFEEVADMGRGRRLVARRTTGG